MFYCQLKKYDTKFVKQNGNLYKKCLIQIVVP